MPDPTAHPWLHGDAEGGLWGWQQQGVSMESANPFTAPYGSSRQHCWIPRPPLNPRSTTAPSLVLRNAPRAAPGEAEPHRRTHCGRAMPTHSHWVGSGASLEGPRGAGELRGASTARDALHGACIPLRDTSIPASGDKTPRSHPDPSPTRRSRGGALERPSPPSATYPVML